MKRRSCVPLDDQPVIIHDGQSPEAEKSKEEVKPLIVPDKYQSWMKMLVAHVQLAWNN